MITKDYIINKAINNLSAKVVVTCPYDTETIEACLKASEQKLCKFIFVGEENKISEVIKSDLIKKHEIELFYVKSDVESASKTMELLKEGKGNVLMKGLIDTSLLLKTMLQKEYGLRGEGLLSHVAMLTKEDAKTYFVTDAAMNIAPTLDQKVGIIKNAVSVCRSLGIERPVVANICAKEKVYDKMPATVDAGKLQEMYKNGVFENCIVSGPLQVDNAVSIEACEVKGVSDEAGGRADILMCHAIEVGNALSKALTYIGSYSFSGILVGAEIPIVLVSRSDSSDEKLLSIALACAV